MKIISIFALVLMLFHETKAFRVLLSKMRRNGMTLTSLAAKGSGNRQISNLKQELEEVAEEKEDVGTLSSTDDTSSDRDIEDGLSKEQSAKIKAEISSPFRGLRKFAYIAMGAAGGLGTFTAVPQLLLPFKTEKMWVRH